MIWLSVALALPFAGEQVVFTDGANLRSGPATDASVVTTLPLGTPVEVVETGQDLTLWGRTAPWVRIRADDHEGWLWSGLVTSEVADLGDGNGFVAGVRGVVKEEHGYRVSVEVSGRVDGSLLTPGRWDLELPMAPAEAAESFFIEQRETGLPDAPRTLTVGVAQRYCAGFAASMHWSVAEGGIHWLATTHSGSDAPVFGRDVLIFPKDEGGKPGIVIRRQYEGEWEDDGTERIDRDVRTEHKVVKGKLVPPAE